MDVLLNWLAQGVVLALAAAAGLRAIPRARTQARYGFVGAAYLLLLVLPAIAQIVQLSPAVPPTEMTTGSAIPLVTLPSVWWTSATVALGLWTIWIGIHAVSFGRAVAAVHVAKRRAAACPRDLLSRLPHWSAVSAKGRATPVVVSSSVRAAGVLSCGAPVIALAPQLLEQLRPADLDRVLVHEWAHVQRRDDLVQLGQRIAWMIVGWHPAAWWFERQLEFEREVACDQFAVSVTGSAKQYAECLVAIAAVSQLRQRALPVLAAVSPSRLHRRVARIVAAPSAAAGPYSSRALVIASVSALLACAVAVARVDAVTFTGTSHTGSATEIAPALDVIGGDEPALPLMRSKASGWQSISGSNRTSRTHLARTSGDVSKRQPAGEANALERLSTLPLAPLPVTPLHEPPRTTVFVPASATLPQGSSLAVTETQTSPDIATKDAPAAWTRAADAGVAIGRGSRTAAVATAGFFGRFAKKVAGSL